MRSFDALLREIVSAIRKTDRENAFLPLEPKELEEASRAYFERGGKFLRPALCLTIAHALGGKEAARRALIPALATEYFHLFTLVHDDVIDHDDLRRGADAAHVLAKKRAGIECEERAAEYGVSCAILAGDALLGRAVELLSRTELSSEKKLTLITRLTGHTLPLLLSGEALDTKLAYLDGVPSEGVLKTVYRNKTGVLFAFALYAGALCACNGEPKKELVDAIDAAACDIGEAFQLTDDYLGLTASEEAMGKPTLSDIREGKRTFFVRFAFDRATEEERAFLSLVLSNADACEKDVLRARDLLLAYGTPIYENRVNEAKRRADALLSHLPEGEARTLLGDLFEMMIRRQH
ncbi:MAG: polyprenyl synthetase family protein [Clostridia bacterium]|nr:polyprenyl synthetase family protein [Clostridia bacterium]